MHRLIDRGGYGYLAELLRDERGGRRGLRVEIRRTGVRREAEVQRERREERVEHPACRGGHARSMRMVPKVTTIADC